MHNNKSYYSSLLKVKNRTLAKQYNFRGMPYFRKIGDRYISQYRMSSGESMLISLIDFINNLVVRNSGTDKLLFLIDEVELALHPSAIDRLAEVLNGLIKESSTELIVYFQRIPLNCSIVFQVKIYFCLKIMTEMLFVLIPATLIMQ